MAPFDPVFIDALVADLRYEALVKLFLSSAPAARYVHERWFNVWFARSMDYMRQCGAGGVAVEKRLSTRRDAAPSRSLPTLDAGFVSMRNWRVSGGGHSGLPLEARFCVHVHLLIDRATNLRRSVVDTIDDNDAYDVTWSPSAVGVVAPTTFRVHVRRARIGKPVLQVSPMHNEACSAAPAHRPLRFDTCLRYRPFVVESLRIFAAPDRGAHVRASRASTDRRGSTTCVLDSLSQVRLIATFVCTETATGVRSGADDFPPCPLSSSNSEHGGIAEALRVTSAQNVYEVYEG